MACLYVVALPHRSRPILQALGYRLIVTQHLESSLQVNQIYVSYLLQSGIALTAFGLLKLYDSWI